MPTITANDEQLRALFAKHPLSFGYLESCNASDAGPDRHFLERTLSREVHIGRGPQNDVALGDSHISWTHCKIAYTEQQHASLIVKLTAKRTTNGTFINGRRLKAGQTRNLVDGDTVSFGVFKVPLPNRFKRMKPDDALEGRGLVVERQKLAHSRWQFKFHVLSRSDNADLSGAGRVLREAWDNITRCKDSVYTARIVLARVRGLTSTIDPEPLDTGPPERSNTATFAPPPADEYHPTNGRKADYKHGDDYFHLVEDPDALSWYHPDVTWLGQVHHKPDPIPYELPFAFKYWSSVYGLPQGLHPRWPEFSSAVYGDDCPDVGPESVLLQGVPAMPNWILCQLTEDDIPHEGIERAQFDSAARHCEIERLYEEGKHVKPNTNLSRSGHFLTAGVFVCESVPASPIPTSLSPVPSKKRTLDAVDGTRSRSSIAPDTPTTHTLEPPRERTKRDAHTKHESQKHLSSSQISTSISTDGPTPSTKVSRPLKRARPGDEGTAEERPAKRVTRATTVAQAAIAARLAKRRQPEPGDDEPIQERPAKRTTRAAKHAPTVAINRTASRSLKRQRTDPDDEQPAVDDTHAPSRPLKRQHPERDREESLQHRERPAKRITRAASNAPSMAVHGTSRPVRRQRLTNAVASTETSEADDTNTRRSTRLQSKLALGTQ